MFSMHDFVFQTIAEMIGKEPEYKVRQYALSWLEKDVLTQEDLAMIEETFSALATADEQEEEE